MNKDTVLFGLMMAVLAVGGGYHYYQSAHSKPNPDAVATAKSLLGKGAAPKAAPAPVAGHSTADPAAARADALKKQADSVRAARASVESALSGLKVSSILLGDPAVVIISKQDYGVGDPLPLPGNPPKTLKITGINEDGVTLVADGQSYHLAAPAAPDLAASRKK